MNFTQYAQKWNRDENNNFSIACYDNSIEELLIPHSIADADKTDCEIWGISPAEWSDAIETALNERIADSL